MSDYKEKFEKMRVAGNLAARTLDMLTDNICLLYTSPSPRD